MWGVEKDIFDFGQKLGELVETKMYGDNADFTYMVDYIFNLRAWFKANRETKDIKVYMGELYDLFFYFGIHGYIELLRNLNCSL